jgi:hypothetical protein
MASAAVRFHPAAAQEAESTYVDLLFVPDHQATADDGFFAAAGKARAIPTRFERSCKALWNLVERG